MFHKKTGTVYYSYHQSTSYTLETVVSKKVYDSFHQILKIDSEALAIFQGEKLVSKNETFKSSQNQQIYQVYNIIQMKAELDNYVRTLQKQYQIINEQQQKIKSIEQQLKQCQIQLEDLKNESYKNAEQNSMSTEATILQSIIIIQKNILQDEQKIEAEIQQCQDITNSILKSNISACMYCTLPIYDKKIQTPCSHDFHKECFQAQIETNCIQKGLVECYCKNKLKIQILNLIYDNKQSIEIKERIYENQLKQILNQAQSKFLIINACNTCPYRCIRNREIVFVCPYCVN